MLILILVMLLVSGVYPEPEEWDRLYPLCKTGQNQSPINIDTSKVIRPPESNLHFHFHFVNYDEIVPSFVSYNGNSLLLQVNSNLKVSQLPSVNGGGLVGHYIFDQLHFHWSNDVTKEGSVHSFDHVFRFPCEVHLVHFNAKYKTLAEAANHSDGVVILVVLMEEGVRRNIPLRHLINLVDSSRVIKKNMSWNVTLPFPLCDLLPDQTDSFYRYFGSFISPGCQESVTWIIFDRYVTISHRQIYKLASLVDENGRSLSNFNRPAQLLNNRKVTLYHTLPDMGLAAHQKGKDDAIKILKKDILNNVLQAVH